MTIDEQRIFVCEKLLGWKLNLRHNDRGWDHYSWDTVDPSGKYLGTFSIIGLNKILGPLTLDWLHECEMKLTGDRTDENSQLAQYQTNLCLVCGDGQEPLNVYDIDLVRATAKQRLAALVDTLKGSQ